MKRILFPFVAVLMGTLLFPITEVRSESSETQPAWVPFTATLISRTYEITPNGKQLVREKTGIFMRNSEGSIYSRTIPVFGSQRPTLAGWEDNRTGIFYGLSYGQKRYKSTHLK